MFNNSQNIVTHVSFPLQSGLSGWFFDYNYRCQPVDYSLDEKPVRVGDNKYYIGPSVQ